MATLTQSTEFRAVPVPSSFPNPATVIVGKKDSQTTVEVVTSAAFTTTPQPINSFAKANTDVWAFGANTLAANISALAALSKFLEKEVQTLGKPKWAENIKALTAALDNAVTASDKLCDDTNKTLPASKPS